MFTSDPLDLAPAAQRPTRAAWLLLGVGLVFALACAMVLQRSAAAVHRALDVAAAQEAARAAQARREAAARARTEDPAALEKLRARQQLQRALRMSWSGFFGALEAAAAKVDGRVSIVSLAPTQAGVEPRVHVTGLALNTESLLDYVEALEYQPQVKDVMLTAQEPIQSGGKSVLRFHLSLVWQPGDGLTRASGGGK